MSRTLAAAAIQFPVSMDVVANAATLMHLLNAAPEDALVVTPEGAISGYDPAPDFAGRLDTQAIDSAIDQIAAIARQRGQCVVLGACVERDGGLRNASVVLTPDGQRREYWKVNLARAEQGVFKPGDVLPVFDVSVGGRALKLGVQMCREIRHPEQWRHVALAGADVFAFVNNAVGDAAIAPVWRSHLVSRAAELQRFVIAANNAAADQKCPSMIVSPDGGVIAEQFSADASVITAMLDLDLISNWVIDQARADLDLLR